MDFIEFSGKTVEDAITAACEKFVVISDKLEYEIIDKGNTGFLGFNSKPAIIKARIKSENNSESLKTEKVIENKDNNIVKEEKIVREKVVESVSEKVEEEKIEKNNKVESSLNADEIIANAEKFLNNVFEAMSINVIIKSEFISSDNELDIELSGDDMGVLIGKRGQTLDSLQYLVSLVVNKSTTGYVRVKVDTEDYRRRRKDTLENLAKNLSYKVKRTKRPVSLEPMNPYERRIIHSALQNDKYVTTHSEGDEPFRRVVITLKK